MTLSWDAATDQGAGATPQAALTYNVYVRQTDGLERYVVPPMAHVGGTLDGTRQIVGYGNAGQRTSYALKDLPPGKTYVWSVQAIDHSFAGSPFAET